MKKSKICLLVSNDLTHDPRVQKQAISTAKFGYDSLVLGWMNFESHLLTKERMDDGFMVHRGIFMPHWSQKKIILINLKLAKKNFWHSVKIIIFHLFGFATKQKQKLISLAIFLARVRNYIFHKIKIILHLDRLSFLQKKVLIHEPASNSVSQSPEQTKSPVRVYLTKKKTWINQIIALSNSAQYYLNYYVQMNKFMISEGVNFEPEIVHANDLDTLWAGWQIKRKTGAKLVYDAHEIWTEQGLQLPKILLKMYALLEKYLFSKVDFFITVNKSIENELKRRYGVKNLPSEVIYNAPKFISGNYQPIKNGQKLKVLYQGRYSPDRGLEELAESSRYFDNNVELYFRGTGCELTKGRLVKIVEKFGLQEKVKFLEPVAMDELVSGASSFDLGIIAYKPLNINNYFCLPNKIYEYMMSGLALAVSDLPELARIVKANKNGVLFIPSKPKDIARNINKLARNYDLLNLCKKNSLEAAKVNNWETQEQKLKNIYEKLLNT